MRKYLSNVHKMKGGHLQCVNIHYAKFEYKEMKTVEVTDNTNQTPSKHFGWKNVYVQHPSKMRKYSSGLFFTILGQWPIPLGLGILAWKCQKWGIFRAFSCIVKSKNTSYIYLNLAVVLTYNHHCMMYYMRLCNVEYSTVLSQLLPW